jgi:hypothetical protein
MPPARFGAALLAISGGLFAHLGTVYLTTGHLTTGHLGTGHLGTRPTLALTRVSTDPFTNLGSQHATEVEPDVFAFGGTVVGAYQAGRFSTGGASDVGWATSANGGSSWQHGMLPGVTKNLGGGPRARASDPSVVYDAKYRTWMITTLGVTNQGIGVGVSVSRSADGLHWRKPVVAFVNTRKFYDKEWITCDNHVASSHYGNCYIEADIASEADTVIMSTSRNGGASWSTPISPSGSPIGLGGQPLVQPDGAVIVPFFGINAIKVFSSADGGTSWSRTTPIAQIHLHEVAGDMRSGDRLPSAAMDATGTIYLAWQDCRFRAHCSANDIVFSTSANGVTWSRVRRVPIDATTSGVDHFIPGIGVDPATSGPTAKVGLYYYFFPRARCSTATCKLEVGYISSANGGTTWNAAATVAGPMKVSQIASTDQGNMVGDYIATAVVHGKALSIFAVGKAAAAGRQFNEAMYTAGGLPITGGTAKAATGPVMSRAHQIASSGVIYV